jgi:hypothetical protein
VRPGSLQGRKPKRRKSEGGRSGRYKTRQEIGAGEAEGCKDGSRAGEKERADLERKAAAEAKKQQQEARESQKADARGRVDKSQHVPVPKRVTRPKPVRRRFGAVDRVATMQEHETRDGSQIQTPVPGS